MLSKSWLGDLVPDTDSGSRDKKAQRPQIFVSIGELGVGVVRVLAARSAQPVSAQSGVPPPEALMVG
jgi:hypothetical protein